MPGGGSAFAAEETPGARRASGSEAGLGDCAPVSPAAAASRPARAPLPPPLNPRCLRFGGLPAHLLPLLEAQPTCHARARPRPPLRGRPPA